MLAVADGYGWAGGAYLAENQQAVVQSRLRTVAVREIMTADPVTVPASATVTRFLHDLLPWLRYSAFPVVDDGQAVGLVTVRRVSAVPVDERDRTTLRGGLPAAVIESVRQYGPRVRS